MLLLQESADLVSSAQLTAYNNQPRTSYNNWATALPLVKISARPVSGAALVCAISPGAFTILFRDVRFLFSVCCGWFQGF